MYKLGHTVCHAFLFAVVFTMLFTPSTHALINLPPGRANEWEQNGIVFHDYCAVSGRRRQSSSDPQGLGAFDGTSSAGLSDLQAAFVDQYHDIAERLSIEYGIPWEAVIAQGILESASGTSHYARTRNNFFGLNAVDNNPDLAYSYETPEAGWRGYYDFIRDNSNYRNHGAFTHPGDPYEYIKAIKAAGYATDPDYVAKLSKLINDVETRSKQKAWKSSAELLAEHPEMAEAAAANQAGTIPVGPGSNLSDPTSSILDDNSSDDVCSKNEDGLTEEDILNELIEGGMTLEEAMAFYRGYLSLSSSEISAYNFVTCTSDPAAGGNPLYNCVNFTKWFLATQTGTPASIYRGLPNGGQVVGYLSKYFRTGTQPEPYAIFSYGTSAGGHTGVILGINGDKLVIGEAGCFLNAGTDYAAFHNAKEVSLSAFMAKNPTFAYTQ